MKPKQNDHTRPEMSVNEYLMDSAKKPANNFELGVFIWPPVVLIYELNGTARKILLLIWCIMITLMLLLLAFGIPSPAEPDRKVPVSAPSGYPPTQICR
jgi:hypothetical protein